MYGHQFYLANIEKRLEFVNSQLRSGLYNCLEDLLSDMFLDKDDVQREFRVEGYIYSDVDKRFMRLQEV